MSRSPSPASPGTWHAAAGTGVDARANLKGDLPAIEALFGLWPAWVAGSLLLVLQTLLAGLGAYETLRRRGAVPPDLAVVAAASYALWPVVSPAYSGFTPWHGWYVPGFPCLCLLVTLRHPSIRPALALAGAVVAWGSPTASGLLIAVGVATWLVASGWPLRDTCVRLLAFAGGFVIAKWQTLLALWLTVPESHRVGRIPEHAFAAWSLAGTTRDVLEAVTPAAGPVLLLLGLRTVVLETPRARRLVTGVLVLLAVTAVDPLLRGTLGTALPLAGYQWRRVLLLVPWLLTAAAAIAATRLSRVPPRAVVASWITLLVYSLAAHTAREVERRHGSHYLRLLAHPDLTALATSTRDQAPFRVATWADANVSFGGQHAAFAWPMGLETADLYLNAYPQRYHDFWTVLIEPTLHQRPDIAEYFDRWGNMAYLFNPEARLFAPFVPQSSSANPEPPFRLALLSLANVRYVLATRPIPGLQWPGRAPAGSTAGDPLEGSWIRPVPWSPSVWLPRIVAYENPHVLPRAFVVTTWTLRPTSQAVLDDLRTATTDVLATSAFLTMADADTANLPSPRTLPPTSGHPTVAYRRAQDEIHLDVSTSHPGLLVISHAYSPWWRATVHGQAAPVIAVNHAFMGVAVPEGASHVRLRYAPPWQQHGLTNTATLLALLLWALAMRHRPPRSPAPQATGRFDDERRQVLERLERDHYWFSGRQRLVLDLLRRVRPRPQGLVVDLGAGTGRIAHAVARAGFPVVGLDQHRPAASHRPLPWVVADVSAPPLATASADVVLLLDVLEHVDDAAVLADVRRVLQPGGVALITVPAYPWLWSARDVQAGHRRRYTASALSDTLLTAGLRPVRWQRYQCLLLPALVASRLLRPWSESLSAEERPRAMARWITHLEVALSPWVRWPAGSTLVVVCERT